MKQLAQTLSATFIMMALVTSHFAIETQSIKLHLFTGFLVVCFMEAFRFYCRKD